MGPIFPPLPLEKGGGEGFMKVISKSKIDTETQNLRRKN
jgi:hypothetical protein